MSERPLLVSFLFIPGFFLFSCFNLSAETSAMREPSVAGSFYPADRDELEKMVDSFLAKVPQQNISGEIVALIEPHAGYVYSGQVAAHGYKLIEGMSFESVILIGPSHHAGFRGASIWQSGSWKTPLGEVPVDTELAQAIAKENPLFQVSSEAHLPEHSLETQIPFLQKTVRNLKIVPILLSFPDAETSRALAQAIVSKIQGRRVLIVTSTDMSHYHLQSNAVSMDRKTLAVIQSGDSEELARGLETGEYELCGAGAMLTVLEIAKLMNASAQNLQYATSGDVTGDESRVVGYSAFVFTRGSRPTPSGEEEPELDQDEQRELLKLARETLTGRIVHGDIPAAETANPNLKEPRGVFVTLKEKGELRGCIGSIVSKEPLYLGVRNMTVAAALNDPRFPPVTKEEVNNLEIEISVLTTPRKVETADEIELGKHGVILERGENSGVFLPQVAEETGWSKEEFLNELASQKAGLASSAWKDPETELYVFSAQVFSEKDFEE